MKQLSLLVVFFYACTIAYPYQLRAVAPIGLLLPGVIGVTVAVIGGTYYAKKIPAAGYSFDGHSLTTSLWAYKKIAQVGIEKAFGKEAIGVFKLENAYNQDYLKHYPYLWNSIKDFFDSQSSGQSSAPPVGAVVDGSACSSLSSSIVTTGECRLLSTVWISDPKPGCAWGVGGQARYYYQYYELDIPPRSNNQGQQAYDVFVCPAQPTDEDVNYPPGIPDVLPKPQVGPLAKHLNDAIPSNPSIGADIDQLMKDHPELWAFPDAASVPANPTDITDYPPAQPITGADIRNWAQDQSAVAQQEYIDNLEELVAANPDNAELKAELERAKAEQAQQEAEDIADTFDSIAASPFGEAYAPGEFDIPARFTAFLNNVKSSGLFSFSSSFFNSLPGGGSPVYEIEAGQYGHHRIDLSQLLSPGLAVLKTVFLLLFGFLSIRVVIMKR